MSGVAQNYYDGEARGFDRFLPEGILAEVPAAKIVVRLERVQRKFPTEFAVGVEWSKGFLHRNSPSDKEPIPATTMTDKRRDMEAIRSSWVSALTGEPAVEGTHDKKRYNKPESETNKTDKQSFFDDWC